MEKKSILKSMSKKLTKQVNLFIALQDENEVALELEKENKILGTIMSSNIENANCNGIKES